MMRETPAWWLLTAVFVATGAYSVLRAAGHGPWRVRLSHGSHVLMCSAMAVMPWAWPSGTAGVLLLGVFAVAGLWHLGLAFTTARPADASAPGPNPGRGLLLAHAGMMFAMVWMAALMSAMTGTAPSGGTGSAGAGMTTDQTGAAGMSGHTMPGDPMPGHTMSGDPMGSADAAAMPMNHLDQPVWAHGVTVAVTALLLAVTCLLVTVAARTWHREPGRSRRLGVGDGVVAGVMASGMAASLVLMW
ncbi:MAG TPA: DUF5134 domain-containing protein [Kineosporiaceae bacterium]|nr:DUF5134 domain-containing protein [Kineosporiaceae bacterium]